MKNTKRALRLPALSLAALAAVSLSACTNLTAVRTFATTSAAAVENKEVLADYARSPVVLARLAPADRSAELKTLAKERAKQRARLWSVQRVLGHYFRTLGDLAASSLPSANSEIGALTIALEDAKGVVGAAAIPDATFDAAGSIAKVLTRLALDRWRQAKVAEIVREVDPFVQRVVAGLGEVVQKHFSASLDQEAEAIRGYFETALADAKSRGEEEATGRLARYLEAEALDGVEARRQKLAPYLEALGKVGKGHAELAANAGTLDGKTLVDQLEQLSKELGTLATAAGKLGS
jgi:hypothetical protein